MQILNLHLLFALTVGFMFQFGCSCSKKNNNAGNGDSSSETGTTDSGGEIDQTIANVNFNTAGPYIANGLDKVNLRITFTNAAGRGISGIQPTIAVTGSGNTLSQTCNASDDQGVSYCPGALTSTVAESKIISVTEPATFEGPSIVFSVGSLSLVGYQKRSCGFDMDRDGTVGEAEDCKVCDGVTTDPDGDLVDENIFYIHGQNGSDTTGDGSAENPFQSLNYAWSQSDGNVGDVEDIFCIAGVLTESLDLGAKDGVAGSYNSIYSADNFAVELPSNPIMIVGWDQDGDGSYPPVDTDDSAIIDGGGTLTYAFNGAGGEASDYFEYAHFTVKNFQSAEVFDLEGNGDYVYLHDLRIENVNDTVVEDLTQAVFGFGGDYNSLVNVDAVDVGGRFVGPNTGPDLGRYIADNSVEFSGQDELFAIDIGLQIQAHIENNYFDANSAAWTPTDTDVTGVTINWNQGMVIRGNTFIDFNNAFHARTAWASAVSGATFRFEKNSIIMTYAHLGTPYAINLASNTQTSAGAHFGSVLIANNSIFVFPGVAVNSCIRADFSTDFGTGVDLPAAPAIVHNTCFGNAVTNGLWVNNARAQDYQDDMLVSGNIFTGVVTNIRVEGSLPTSYDGDDNVFESGGGFAWNGGNQSDVATWSAAVPLNPDQSSDECTPTFTNLGTYDLSLAAGDTCATDNASATIGTVTDDITGKSRDSSPDAGAYEK